MTDDTFRGDQPTPSSQPVRGGGAPSASAAGEGPTHRREPMGLRDALATFETVWSPRIVTQVNDYDVRVAKMKGDYIWHLHTDTDEFFMLIDGELSIGLRDGEPKVPGGPPGERVVTLAPGSVFVVPRGVEHRPSSVAGASVLLFEPTGTLTVGDQHEPVPEHVDATTGHALTSPTPHVP
ncbi:mannose-6-phosphate isomerase-like protein (cupin superfamily) [Streptomyces zagrosensis]|uniref:Mannose-6-phosphate isomerase-like protein (Cupin superfamily) n=2 Tax=Streptomyces zagrosensis TaxID=1042984 RepID=A0A7W9QD84_9ACTN|nr:mannose-6-phosphate isomerase-like protein (cupin superfamily) [Streptomyces zagrosensis]